MRRGVLQQVDKDLLTTWESISELWYQQAVNQTQNFCRRRDGHMMKETRASGHCLPRGARRFAACGT